MLYAKGRGVGQDLDEAKKWLRKAADQSHDQPASERARRKLDDILHLEQQQEGGGGRGGGGGIGGVLAGPLGFIRGAIGR